jgi:hypothetical protein
MNANYRKSGIISDRLTPSQQEVWRAIAKIAEARSGSGNALYPTLRRLWDWVSTSGHAIYINLPEGSDSTAGVAGSFTLTHFDPLGLRHEAVITLHRRTIDLAHVGSSAMRPGGFIPFMKLTRIERYVEVLGHELAHAVHILSSLERSYLVVELVERTNAAFRSSLSRKPRGQIGPEMLTRLAKRDRLLQTLESHATSVEAAIWKELLAARPLPTN